MEDVFIYDAVRTPRGKGKPAKNGNPGGALCEVAPHELVVQLIEVLLQRHGDTMVSEVQRLVLGCVGQIGPQGGHIALVSRLASALRDNTSAQTLNNYCVSGLSAIADAFYRARSDEPGLMIAGGVECLSQVGFFEDRAAYYSNPAMIEALKWAPPIMGAELMATIEGYTKEDLDELTLTSHRRASAAWQAGHYDKSVVPVKSKDGSIALVQDEYVTSQPDDATLRGAAPAFGTSQYACFDKMMLEEHPELDKISHQHSIANCPGPADGAALTLLGTRQAGRAARLSPLARIASFAEASGDPVLQFGAGFQAMEVALARAGLQLADIELVEFMEAFAAPALKFLRDYRPDPSKVNVNGGHLAMGHPMGATGAILVTTLLHEMIRRDLQTGLVVALAGSGLGAAIVLERT